MVAGITVLAAVLRFATLDRQSFWSDEAITAVLLRMDFSHMLRTVSETESTPPLYYALAWLWAKVFGYGEVGLRSLSALSGTATVPVAYASGSVLAGRRTGLMAAALVAVSPLLVWYSQEARAYALVVFLCAGSFAAFARTLQNATPRALVLWAATSVLAVWTHYFAIFVVGVELLLLVWSQRRAAVVWAAAVVLAGTIAVAPLALAQRSNGLVENISASNGLGERLVVQAKQLLIGQANLPADRIVAGGVVLLLALSLVMLAAQATVSERRGARVAAKVGGAVLLVPVALAAAGLDYVNTRNVVPGFVPLAIAASAGMSASAARRIGKVVRLSVLVILVTITLVVTTDRRYHRPDWRGFARAVGPPEVARAVVVAPDHQGWTARLPLRIYMSDARAVDEGIAPVLSQFADVSRRGTDHATPSRVIVREVVVAAVGWELPRLSQPLPSSFTVARERIAPGYRFVLYRSSHAVSIPTASLGAPLSAVLLEQPTPAQSDFRYP